MSKTIYAIIISLAVFSFSAKLYSSQSAKHSLDLQNQAISSIYDVKAERIDGSVLDFSVFKGKVLLIVNTASKCGFTPQYEDLQRLHEKYDSLGLKILGFPCNQFLKQEPGDNSEIQKFCSINYGVTFTMFSKIEVNGDSAHPLYKFLKENVQDETAGEKIPWNFTKFLIDKEGKVLMRFEPKDSFEMIIAEIEKLL